MLRLTRLLMASMPLLASAGAHAMSIGAIDVSSALGEPLRARVPIVLDEGGLALDDCVRIVGPARNHPDLAKARVELNGQGGRYYVSISTETPISDPMLDLSLSAEDCGVPIRKDFVLLLSPKTAEAPAMAPMLPAATPAAAAPPAPPRATKAAPRPRAKARASAARPTRAAARPSRLVPRFFLTLDYDHGAFAQMAEKVARDRQAAHVAATGQPVDRRSAATAMAGPGATPDQAAMRPGAESAPQAGDRLVLQPPPDDFTPPGQAGQAGAGQEPSAMAAPDTGMAPGTAPGTAPATAREGGVAGLTGTPAETTSTRFGGGWLLAPFTWLWLLLLLALVLAIALWLKLRAPRSRFMDKTAPELDTMLPADLSDPLHHPLLSRNLPPVDEVFTEPPAAKTLLEAALQAPAQPEPTAAAEPIVETMQPTDAYSAGAIQSEEFAIGQDESVAHIMELAEVMLAFGRSSQAIEALSHHIRANPRQSLDPWLKLLDLYQQSNLRQEFEALAADLHLQFNIAIPDWNEYGADSERQTGPLTLESLPHIMSRLTTGWGTRDALDYLDRLLEDNRGGQRLGFSLPIVRDILLLRDILREICAVSALSH